MDVSDVELNKSNDVLEKKIQILEENLIQTRKTNKSSIVEKQREEVACLTKDFGKFLESSNTLTVLLKFYQHPFDKSSLGLDQITYLILFLISWFNLIFYLSESLFWSYMFLLNKRSFKVLNH